MKATFSAPDNQLFECRDCPARCCRTPWSIQLGTEEVERYIDDPWVIDRAGADGVRVLGRKMLPKRVHERRLQCVFLDEDELCSLQKKFGHGYIPRACQAFPFGFLRDEGGALVALLSQYCPSIRDNYGKPVRKQLPSKLKQKGDIERMSTVMSTQRRVMLSQKQYLRVARLWSEQLASQTSPLDVIALMYDQLDAFDTSLPGDAEKTTDAYVGSALKKARTHGTQPLAPRAKPSFQARALYSYLLGNLCYPSRLRRPDLVGGGPGLLGLRSFGNKLAWMRTRGTVDMLLTPRPFKLQHVRKVAPFLDQPPGALVNAYLRQTLDRRQVFSKPRYLLSVIVDLAMATVLISRFARCLALSSERDTVIDDDVREGISVAELVLMSHVARDQAGKTMTNLEAQLLDRERLRDLLASEA